jgi:streptogramin lyase
MVTTKVAQSSRLALLARGSFVATIVTACLSVGLLLTQVDIYLLHHPPLPLDAIAGVALKTLATVGTVLGVVSTIVGFALRRISKRLAQAEQKRERAPSVVGNVAGTLQPAPQQLSRLQAGLGCAFPITVSVLGLSIVVATITYTPAQQVAVALNNPIASGAPGAAQATAAPKLPSGTLKEFPIPTPLSGPVGITAGPDGNLWFVEAKANKVGKITPSGAITEFPIPGADPQPADVTAGPDGNVWFVELRADTIGRITPSGVITEFPVPADGLELVSITAGPDGNLWFCKLSNTQGEIGKMTPSGVVTTFTPPAADTGPGDITKGPDGNLWFADTSAIGRATPAGAITEFPVDRSIQPWDIATGPDGNVWFTDAQQKAVGRITPSGVVTLFPLPSAGDGTISGAIAKGSDGNIWTTYSNALGRVTPSGTVTVVPLLGDNNHLSDITTGPDGNLWFTDTYQDQIGMLVP